MIAFRNNIHFSLPGSLRLLIHKMQIPLVFFAAFLHAQILVPCSAAQEASGDSLVVIEPGESNAPHAPSSDKNFFSRLGYDFSSQVTAPFSMDTNDLLWIGGGVAATIGLYTYDKPIDNFAKHTKKSSPFISSFSSAITEFGGMYGYLGVGFFSLLSLFSGSKSSQETSMLLGEALITSGVWTRLGKFFTGRERPSAAYFHLNNHQRGIWSGPLRQLHHHPGAMISTYDAFPSGHTATAFAIATVVSERYSDNKYLSLISYSLAACIGLSRLTEHAHWASDIFAGACVGYLCGHSVIEYNSTEQIQSSEKAENIEVKKGSTRPQFFFTTVNYAPSIGVAVSF